MVKEHRFYEPTISFGRFLKFGYRKTKPLARVGRRRGEETNIYLQHAEMHQVIRVLGIVGPLLYENSLRFWNSGAYIRLRFLNGSAWFSSFQIAAKILSKFLTSSKGKQKTKEYKRSEQKFFGSQNRSVRFVIGG